MPRAAQMPAYPTVMEWPVVILGVPFDPMTLAGAVDRIESMVAEGGTHYVVTPNVDFLVKRISSYATANPSCGPRSGSATRCPAGWPDPT